MKELIDFTHKFLKESDDSPKPAKHQKTKFENTTLVEKPHWSSLEASNGHKQYDVYHNGVHLGDIHSYTATTRKIDGKNKAQVSKAHKAWHASPKQIEGQPFIRSQGGGHSKDWALEYVLRMHDIIK